MTKQFLTALVLLLLTATATQAQSLTKTNWFTDLSDDGQDIGMIIDFDEMGGCYSSMIFNFKQTEDGITVSLHGRCIVPGSYVRNGNEILVRYNRDATTINIDTDISGGNESMRQMFDSMLKSDVEKLMRSEAAGFPESSTLTILTLTDTELRLHDGDEIRTFVAVAKE